MGGAQERQNGLFLAHFNAQRELAVSGTEVAVGVAMLRITRLPERHEVPCLRVEGRLVGDWVGVLQVEVEHAQAQTAALELDLAGVEFADSQALSLLHEVAQRGVKLVACSPLLISLLESRPS